MSRSAVRKSRMGMVGAVLGTVLSGCVQQVPVTLDALPGSEARIVAAGGMPVFDLPRQGAPVDVGCRVTEFEGRVDRVAHDTVYMNTVLWWRAEPGRRPACQKVGARAMVIMPDSSARELRAIQHDEKRTNRLAAVIVGALLLIAAAATLLFIALLNSIN